MSRFSDCSFHTIDLIVIVICDVNFHEIILPFTQGCCYRSAGWDYLAVQCDCISNIFMELVSAVRRWCYSSLCQFGGFCSELVI